MGLYVVGTGGAGREVLDVALAVGEDVAGFLDERTAGSVVRGLPVLLPALASPGRRYVIGIADAEVRRRIAGVLDLAGLSAATLLHPSSVRASESVIGLGSVVMALAHVSSDVRLGRHVHLQYGASVGHDSVLEDTVTVLPGARISGNVVLSTGCTVGSGAVVLQGRRVGAGAFVGAGAVVTRDVPAGTVVVGNPARPLRPS